MWSQSAHMSRVSVSIKSQLIINSCWAGIIWRQTGPGWVTSTPGTRQLGLLAWWWLVVKEGELRSCLGRHRCGLICPAEARLQTGNPSPPPPLPSTQSPRALKWKLTEEILGCFFSGSEAGSGNQRPRGQTEHHGKDNLLEPNLFITKIKL